MILIHFFFFFNKNVFLHLGAVVDDLGNGREAGPPCLVLGQGELLLEAAAGELVEILARVGLNKTKNRILLNFKLCTMFNYSIVIF
jgi:hypothetical protein